MKQISDTDRLDFLERMQHGCGLVHDDNRHWAVVSDGLQSVVEGSEPQDFLTTFFVDAVDCRRTIREAIDLAIQQEINELTP